MALVIRADAESTTNKGDRFDVDRKRLSQPERAMFKKCELWYSDVSEHEEISLGW
jgi:hypothetical protein